MKHPIIINGKGKLDRIRIIGFRVIETIGIAIINPRGILRGNKALKIGL